MAFQSFGFLAFLLVTLAVCLGAGRRSSVGGKRLLYVACVFFYCATYTAYTVASFFLLSLSAGLTFQAGRALASGRGRRRLVFALTLGWHIAVLMAFKYLGFFTGGAVSAPFAPLGLSFFTFQQIWYLKEIYTGQYPAGEVARIASDDFALYSLFFPTVSSGPILRPGAFFPQIQESRFLHPTWEDVAAGVYAMVIGCAKKVLLADAFGVIVTNGFAHPERLTTLSAGLVIVGYSLQLYFDFSGYCDMATGMARLFGLRLPLNFNSPYRATSVGEFWKRWHMTLTTFLRECLYFPLGGSKKGALRAYVNIMIVFLVSGFWHGAGWTFLLWGALHGVAQVIERLLGARLEKIPKLIRWAGTFAVVSVAWVYFRAPSVAAGNAVLSAALSFDFMKPEPWLSQGIFTPELEAVRILLPALAPWRNLLAVAVLYLVGMAIVLWPKNAVDRMDSFRPTVWRAAALWVLALWSILSFSGITQFIYSNF